jgi:hypothetical protein
MTKPRFRHDCNWCHFLGHHDGHDLYYCDEGNPIPTVIARYGNLSHEYESGLALAGLFPAIREAKRQAQLKGLLPEDDALQV